MKIVVFGKDGQVGKALQALSQSVESTWSFVGRAEVDLREAQTIRDYLERIAPDLVINAAAYTAVDQAQNEEGLAMAINAMAPNTMAQYCAEHHAQLVHYSTDYVFDGRKLGWYTESDATKPLGVYGQSKLAGETLIAKAFSERANTEGRYWVLRTSWVYGEGNNFIRTMLRLARERATLRVINDQYGVPTSAAFLAKIGLAMASVRAPDSFAKPLPLIPASGIYHCVPSGQTTWHGLATHVIGKAHALGLPLLCPTSAIEAIPAIAYPLPAPRPQNSKMDTGKLCEVLGIDALPNWQEHVDSYVAQCVNEALG